MKSFILITTLISIISLATGAINEIGYQYRKSPPNPLNSPQYPPTANTLKSIIRNDHKGNYVYGFETSDGIVQRQAGGADGSKRGYYSYVDPDGRTYTVCYIADEYGYRIVGDPKLGAIKEIQCPYDKDKRRPDPLAKSTGYYYGKPEPTLNLRKSGYGYEKPLSSLAIAGNSYQGKTNYPVVPGTEPFLPPYY